MQVFVAQVINGLSLGSIYVLLVTGFNLLLLVAMIIHFSYPQVVVFSMYVAWGVLKYTGNRLVLGVLGGSRSILKAGLISLTMGQVVALGVGVIAVSAFFLLLYRSRAGRAFRAIAEDPNGARLVGIPLLSTGFASYAITGLLGGVSAIP